MLMCITIEISYKLYIIQMAVIIPDNTSTEKKYNNANVSNTHELDPTIYTCSVESIVTHRQMQGHCHPLFYLRIRN